MEEKQPLVSIITVNYNGRRLLKECFESVSALNYPKDRIEIIMVDNGSSDDSAAFTAEHFPAVRVIENKENNYCAANNLGIEDSRGDFVCLVNNDVRLEPDWLINLIEVFNTDSKIGAATGKIFFPDGKLQNTGLYDLPGFYWSDRGFKEEDRGQYNSIEYVRCVSNCAVMYGKRCLQDIGYLDRDFNMYLEDVDMSFRALKTGWKLVYVPGSVAYHKFHGTASEKDVAFYCERNRLLFIAKHHPEELAGSLFGRGYFTAVNSRKDLSDVLPAVLLKVKKHHGVKKAGELLPGILDSIKKVSNWEKDFLVKQLDAFRLDIVQKEQIIARKEEELAARGQRLAERDEEISGLRARVSCIEAEAKEKGETLVRKEEELAARGQCLAERDEEISGLRARVKEKGETLVRKEEELAARGQCLAERDEEICSLRARVSCIEAEAKEKGETLVRKEEELAARGQRLAERDKEICSLRAQLQQIYTSETYRFLARPLWRVMDAFKRKKRDVSLGGKTETLVIKPFCVSAAETKSALDYLMKTSLRQNIVLLANVFADDYELFLKEDGYEKILYCPSRRRLSSGELFRLILRIRKRRFSETILLAAGHPPYQGYRKGKLLAAFSGARKPKVFFLDVGRIEPLNRLNNTCRTVFSLIYGNTLLFIVVGLFLCFVVVPLKIRKILLKK